MVGASALRRWRGPLADLGKIAGLAAVYWLTGQLGLRIGTVGGFAAPVWPPSGIALVALLLFGRRVWPGVALGAFLLNLSHGAPAPAAFGIGIGNALEGLVATHLLVRRRFELSLARPADVLALVVAALVSTPISATIGVGSLFLSGAVASSTAVLMWVPWVVGDILSLLVLAPVLLLLPVRDTTQKASILETALAFASVLATSLVVLGGTLPPELEPILGRAYLIYPVLLWPSIRIGPRGSAIAMVLVSIVAIGATRMNRGAFASDDYVTALIALQVFIGVVALTQLLLASAVAESRLRDTLMSIASHELRGPIGTLGLTLEMARETPTPQAIDSAQKQVRRLAALVQELLDATRVGAQRLMLNPVPTDLAEVAAAVVVRLGPELGGARCEVSLRAQPCKGTWDPLRMDQLITNLVSNAIRHAPGAPVTISVEPLGDRVRLRVADQGPGIAPRDQARIFDAYRSLERKGPGLGLGLHIARDIVVAHGGTLRIESELGHGAAFIAELPCTPAAARRARARWPFPAPRLHRPA